MGISCWWPLQPLQRPRVAGGNNDLKRWGAGRLDYGRDLFEHREVKPHFINPCCFGDQLPRGGVNLALRQLAMIASRTNRPREQDESSPASAPSGTRRNNDVGSRVQSDATSGTFLFTVTQSGVMRIWLYVALDDAIGVKPGIAAVVQVPELPGALPGRWRSRPTRPHGDPNPVHRD